MYELSKDHEDFRKVVREFATEAVEPHVAQWDRPPLPGRAGADDG